MRATLLCLLVLCWASTTASVATVPVDDARRPYFCGGLDCPTFDVLETSGDVQLRRYASQRYITTSVDGAESLLAAQVVGTKVRGPVDCWRSGLYGQLAVLTTHLSATRKQRLLAYLAGDNADG
jgi:hypothetical protein